MTPDSWFRGHGAVGFSLARCKPAASGVCAVQYVAISVAISAAIDVEYELNFGLFLIYITTRDV